MSPFSASCTVRWLGVICSLVVSTGALGCGDASKAETNGGGSGSGSSPCVGSECPGDPIQPRPDGCQAPPPKDANPLTSYEWNAPAPNHVVTNAADSGPGSLRAALEATKDGDVVGFDSSLAGGTIKLASELIVPASITLDASAAPGFTLDGQGKTRVMSIARQKDTTLVGLRFLAGSTDGPGGALHVEQVNDEQAFGSVRILACAFEKNRGGRGGAVRVGWRIHAVVENSVFVDNDGSGGSEQDRGFSAGGISTSQNASLVVRRSRFERNRGHIAGAVYNILEPVTVEDSIFIDNVALGGSGAFFTDGGNGVGPDNDPVSGERGEITLRRVRMHGNRGAGAGGALLIWGYPRDVITISSSIVQGSVLEGDATGDSKGGAARLHALDRISIRDSSFTDNRSEQQGGALWIDGDGPLELENVTFARNNVDKDAGGAINYNGHGKVTINNCLFAQNHAGRACGAFWFGDQKLDMTVTNTIFALNTAADVEQRHVGYRPKDGGGNLEWVTAEPSRGRVFESSLFLDPLLAELSEIEGSLLQALTAGSPAIDAAGAGAVDRDARGALRDQKPDIGPYEAEASCQR